MNTVSARLLVSLALWLAASVHHTLVAGVANTPGGMLIYHGAALLFDYATLAVSAILLDGKLSDDMQTLCLVSMIVNFLGWIAYLAYVTPTPYNYAIVGVSYVQYARLILGDHDAYRMGHDLVRRRDSLGPKFHSEEANR